MRAAQPENLQARYLEADCRLRLGEAGGGDRAARAARVARPDDLAVAYMLGMAYLQNKQPRRRAACWSIASCSNGDSAEARLMMGMAKRGAQDLAGGLEDLGKAVELNPELPGVHTLYGQALLETGNRDQGARPNSRPELTRNPLDFEANLLLGVHGQGRRRV